ncbi:MAG: ABC transporter ATP-binding protein [Actinomycetota bacterium]
MSGLHVEGASVRYGDAEALRAVTLQVPAGETLAVVGPSGSGKSTLLRAIAGLEPLATGSISADGRSLDGVAPHERGVGLMFQDHALFPHLDVAGNVGFGLRMAGLAAAARDGRVGELLDLVGLGGFAARSVQSLSGGEAQRVALARALAPEPAVLLLDEPLGSLDRLLREELIDELRGLLRSLGQTTVHVTHDQGEAVALGNRVAVLDRGRVVQVDEPEMLWRHPATAFIASFVGHPNVWPAEIDQHGSVMVAGHRLAGPDSSRANTAGRTTVVVPVTAWRVGTGPPEPTLSGEVRSARFVEGRYRAEVAVNPSDRASASAEPLVATLIVDARVTAGDRVDMALDPAALHLIAEDDPIPED